MHTVHYLEPVPTKFQELTAKLAARHGVGKFVRLRIIRPPRFVLSDFMGTRIFSLACSPVDWILCDSDGENEDKL